MTFFSAEEAFEKPGSRSLGTNARVLLAALYGTLVFALIQFATYTPDGFPSNDDLLRMVHVQDLLAGQSWYDSVQYRLGLEDGTVMHWSKLVDAPIAALVLVGGEPFAAAAWPGLLAFATLAGLVLGAVRISGTEAILSASVIGVAALWSIGAFSIGAFDHHNVQVALLIWSVALLTPGPTPRRDAALSGLACALMLTIGMETLPYVAVLGLWVAAGFAFQSVSRQRAGAFGLGLACTTLAIYPVLVAPSQWAHSACDAFSSFHLALALCGGFGLWASTMFGHRGMQWGMLGLSGFVGLAVLVGIFPHCLANPLADLPPLVWDFWLEGVVETRSAFDIMGSDPFSLIAFFAMPILALLFCGAAMTLRFTPVAASLFFSLLLAAIAVTVWQQRGFLFAAALAVIPLAMAVTRTRLSYQVHQKPAALAAMVLAWMVSINPLWFIASAELASAFSSAPTLQEQIAAADRRDFCYDPALYTALVGEKDAIVLSSTNVGPMILAHTEHRAIAGPYHRNIAGNLMMIETMLGDPAQAERSLADHGVTHIADCLADPGARDFTRAAPTGFQAQLHRDHEQFDWLELVPATADAPLRLFRVLN